MTGNTTATEKVRAVFLAVLMVLSVVAVSAAFTGSVAAVSDTTGDGVTANVTTTGVQANHSANVTVDSGDSVAGNDVDNITVNYSNFTATGTNTLSTVINDDSATVLVNGSEVTVNDVTQGPTADADSAVINISATAVDVDSTVEVQLEGVQNPESAESQDVSVNLTETGGTSTTLGTLTLETTPPNVDVDPNPGVTTVGSGVEYTATVTDSNDDPIDGVDVVVEDTDGDLTDDATGAANLSTTITTNATGEAPITLYNTTAAGAGNYNATFTEQLSDGAGSGQTETTVNHQASDQDTAFIDGDIGDTQLNPIEDDRNISLTVTDDNGNTIVDNVQFKDFDTLAQTNAFVASAGFTSGDVSADDRGEYFLELESGGTTTYNFEADLGGFDAFDGDVTVGPGQQEDRNVRLVRLVNADRISVIDPADDPENVEPVDGDLDITTFVETEDEAGAGFNPLGGTNVDATVTNVDDPNNVITGDGSDVTIAPSNTTNANGEALFNVQLDLTGVSTDDIDQNIDVTVEFTATESGDGPAPTVTQNVTFVAEPPSGQGSIAGDVDEISEDIQLGAQSQNADAADGINVHAVQLERAEENEGGFDDTDETEGNGALDEGDNFFRVVNSTTGEVLDVRSDYLVKTGLAATGPVELAHNTSIAGTGFDATSDDGTGYVDVFVLEPGEYKIQNSGNGSFDNPTNVTTFTAANDLTYDATADRYENVSAQHTDVTGSDGEYFLTNLYTAGTLAGDPATEDYERDYLVIAGDGNPNFGFANGLGYDQVTVSQNAENSADQYETNLAVQSFNATVLADSVNITQVGTHPALDETDGAPDVEQIEPFDDNTDDTYQRVSRDGTIDVIRVDSRSSEFDIGVSETVTVELADDFDGQFLGTVLDGGLNADSSLLVDNDEENTTITVQTDANGTAYVLLQTESNSTSLDTQKNATIDNELNADLNQSNVTFVGTTTFDRAGVSGIARDSDDTLVPNSVIWAEQIQWGDQQIRIEPDTDATPGTTAYSEAIDDPTDEFVVTLQEWNGSAYVAVNSDTNVTRSQLGSYEFNEFESITSVAEFKLLDIAEDPETASYTLEPVPAAVGSETDYELRGVKLDAPEQGFRSLTGSFAVDVGEGETQNVIFPIDIETANLEVSGVSNQTITEGENTSVDVVVENTGGNQGATQTLELVVDGDVVASQVVTVDAGETNVFTLEGDTSDLSAGEYDITVSSADSEATATLTVENGNQTSIVDQYDEDGNGIDAGELGVAFQDFQNGDISGQQLQAVFEAWQSN